MLLKDVTTIIRQKFTLKHFDCLISPINVGIVDENLSHLPKICVNFRDNVLGLNQKIWRSGQSWGEG